MFNEPPFKFEAERVLYHFMTLPEVKTAFTVCYEYETPSSSGAHTTASQTSQWSLSFLVGCNPW